uniref:Uncharacterized protein n=1 Tax=Arundo donax TaxID=35708 RepID=A0A0A9BCD1_ARUDO
MRKDCKNFPSGQYLELVEYITGGCRRLVLFLLRCLGQLHVCYLDC